MLQSTGCKLYIVTMTIWAPEMTERPGPRYLAIADAIADDLSGGRLAPGARLPTHRDLADRLGVTVGTVSRGYAEAARRGLLSGEVGRGTFVRHLPDLAVPSASDAFVDLSLNYPPAPAGETQRNALQATLQLLAGRSDVGALLGYPSEGGLATHREAGAAWIAESGLAARP